MFIISVLNIIFFIFKEMICREKSRQTEGCERAIAYLKNKIKDNAVAMENETKMCNKSRLIIGRLENDLQEVLKKQDSLEKFTQSQRMELDLDEENVSILRFSNME